jgi:hypothetical protein
VAQLSGIWRNYLERGAINCIPAQLSLDWHVKYSYINNLDTSASSLPAGSGYFYKNLPGWFKIGQFLFFRAAGDRLQLLLRTINETRHRPQQPLTQIDKNKHSPHP